MVCEQSEATDRQTDRTILYSESKAQREVDLCMKLVSTARTGCSADKTYRKVITTLIQIFVCTGLYLSIYLTNYVLGDSYFRVALL
jgi:hypothetical protein